MVKQPSIAELFNQSLSNAIGRPTIHNYKPHAKQLKFHKSTKKVRLYIGGNRAGKTVGGSVESIYHMKGESPYRRLPPAPTYGRIVTVSRIEGIDQLIIPELSKWMPPSLLINGSWEDSYEKSKFLLTCSNGSTAQLMTYEQDVEKFAGRAMHWIWCDEEPPEAIYRENRMRLIDYGGSIWITMTPVEGMTWSYHDIFMPGVTGNNPQILVVVIDTEENPYLSQEQIDEVIAELDENDRKARKQGQYVALGGLVYKCFDQNIHVYREPLDTSRLMGWNQYASMDHGLNNPTVFLFHAVHPRTGFIVTFDEIYVKEHTVKEVAALYHTRCRQSGRRYPDVVVGDPSIKNRQATDKLSIQKHYQMAGIPILLGNNDIATGVDRVTSYLKAGMRVITEQCPNLIRETQQLRWKIYEDRKKRRDNNPRPEIHKYKDHAPDADRYFHAHAADLKLESDKDLTAERVNAKVRSLLGPRSYNPVAGVYDDNVIWRGESNTEWTTVDEHMGGYF